MTSTSRWDTGFPDPDELRSTARQARQLPVEPTSRTVRAVVVAAVVTWAVTVVIVYATLPERVPTHWSGTSPDAWSSRAGALGGFVVTPVVMSVILLLVPRLVVRWPQGINAPNKEYWLATPQRLRHFQRLISEDVLLIVALCALFFAALSAMTGVAARRPGGEMPGVFFAVIMIAFVAGMLGVLVRILLGGRYRGSTDG